MNVEPSMCTPQIIQLINDIYFDIYDICFYK